MMNGISQLKVTWVLLLLAVAAGMAGCGSKSNNTATTPGNTNIFYASSVIFRNVTTPMGWGYNGFGQLGDGTTTNKVLPTVISRPGSFRGLVHGGYHSLAFGTYTAWTAGGNSFGQLGRTLATNVTQETAFNQVSFANYTRNQQKPRKIINVAAGGSHNLLVDENGKVWAWGGGGFGQLGNNARLNSTAPVPVVVDTSLTLLLQISKVAAGGSHSLALTTGGVVYAWGYNGYGQLGQSPVTVPTQAFAIPVGGLPTITQIAASGSYSLALDNAGYLWGWGYNGRGQVGKNPLTDDKVLTPFKNFSGVTQVAAGLAHVVVLRSDGVWTWGFNDYGQLGDNSKIDRFTPAPVPGLVGTVSEVRAFGNQTFARIGSSWYAWGDNSQGQLGYSTGTLLYSMAPGLVQGF